MPKSKYRIRTVCTASGATAVQVVWYENNTRKIAKHIGSVKNNDELEMLSSSAKQYIAEDAIRAHVCFMALMISKFIEIKTGFSLRYVRDLLWLVQEVHLRDSQSNNRERVARTPIPAELTQIINCLGVKFPH